MGNHEKYLADPSFKPEAFKWINYYYTFSHKGTKIVLFHFPVLSWDGAHHGSIHLYGHVHNSGLQHPEYGEKLRLLGPRAFNVGVDVNDFYPVSFEAIMEKASVLL